jgi:hypothetical protein
MTTCCTCFTDYIVQCPDEIQVYAQLQPTTMYTWVITDKFGKQWSDSFTTDADGFWVIPVADLPAGLLTEFSGSFKLEVIDQSCKPVKFKIAQEYTCIAFSIKGGTRVKDNLGCTFETVFQGQTFASYVVDTFADAEALATGNQFVYIVVENDEDKGENNTSYVYVPGFPELVYLGAAVPNSET